MLLRMVAQTRSVLFLRCAFHSSVVVSRPEGHSLAGNEEHNSGFHPSAAAERQSKVTDGQVDSSEADLFTKFHDHRCSAGVPVGMSPKLVSAAIHLEWNKLSPSDKENAKSLKRLRVKTSTHQPEGQLVPYRPMSAFMYFYLAEREAIGREYRRPEMSTMRDVMEEKWEERSEKEKEKYYQLEQKDRELVEQDQLTANTIHERYRAYLDSGQLSVTK